MFSMPLITKVSQITVDRTRSQFSTNTSRLIMEVETQGGPAVLEISTAAAAELREELGKHLQARGSP
jgi:hypothetical protein